MTPRFFFCVCTHAPDTLRWWRHFHTWIRVLPVGDVDGAVDQCFHKSCSSPASFVNTVLQTAAEGEGGAVRQLWGSRDNPKGAAWGGAGAAGEQVPAPGPDVRQPNVASHHLGVQMLPVFCVRLKSFYQREWDKVHQIYQEEADRCCMMMEDQVRT